MESRKSVSIPARLIVLDVLGTLLLVTGSLKLVAGIEVFPGQARFGDELVFIVAGIILMLPLIVHVIVRAIRRAKSSEND